jgi:hypothetical protein
VKGTLPVAPCGVCAEKEVPKDKKTVIQQNKKD